MLEGSSAAQAFGTAMDTYNVPDAVAADQTCEQGVKSQRQWLGNGWQADGCYRYNQRAELRFVDNATDCKKLKVGDKTMVDTLIPALEAISAAADAGRSLPEFLLAGNEQLGFNFHGCFFQNKFWKRTGIDNITFL